MKLKTIFHRAAAGALCLLFCAASLAQTALAVKAPGSIDSFNPNASCTLTIRYRAYPNVTFNVYRVASVDQNVNFTAEGVFRNAMQGWLYSLNNQTQSQWAALARHLSRYAASARPAGTVSTGTPGAGVEYVDMTVNNLKPGLYLVVGNPYTETYVDGKNVDLVRTITPAPYLVCLPNWTPDSSSAGGSWSYSVLADAREKVEITYGTKKNIQVTKSWINNGHTQPTSATVVLYRNGVEYSRVVLSQANNWKYTWTDLDATAVWTIGEENRPEGYSYYTEWVNAYNVRVTNYTPPPGNSGNSPSGGTNPPSGTNPPRVTPPPDVDIDDPDVPLGNKTPPPEYTDPGEDPPEEIELDDPDVPLGDLPQTGQLWWPVPLLAVLGMVFVLIGLIRRRRGEYDEE